MKSFRYFFDNDVILVNSYLVLSKKTKDYDFFSVFDLWKKNKKSILGDTRNIFEEKTDFGMNDLSKFDCDEVVLLYFEVISDCEQQVIIDVDIPGNGAIWCNNKLILFELGDQKRRHILSTLYKGKNYFHVLFMRIENYQFPPYLFMQIYRYSMFEKYTCLSGMKSYVELEQNKLVYSFSFEKFSFVFFSYGTDVSFVTAQVNSDQFVDYLSGELYSINISSIEKDTINVSVATKEGVVSFEINLLSQPHNLLDIMCLENKHYICNETINYVSSIDKTIREIKYNYSKKHALNKQSPLLVCLCSNKYEKFECYDPDNILDDFIICEINCRGILGGGYISESCILEAIDVIHSNFCIDKNRMYLVGKSNGGYAVWSIVSNYPDIFAAAVPISGYPYIHNINNVSNIYIDNYVSNADVCYMNQETDLLDLFKSNCHYSQHRIDNLLHHVVCDFRNYDLFQFFVGKEKNNFPKKIYFRTERNRYLKSFWVNLHGIEQGEKYAEINVEVIGERIIISTNNDLGFSLFLPPYINKLQFEIVINNNSFCFFNYSEDFVHFFRSGTKHKKTDTFLPINYRKGTGLLDVFVGEMVILIPRYRNEIIDKIAGFFSSPKSNGYIEKIDVQYPIYSKFSLINNPKCNYVIIQTTENTVELDLEVIYPIITTQQYFEYKNKKYYGDYCVMQVIAHPQDITKSILFICANNEKMLRRNIIIRKVVIPFLHHGYHEYWNNEGLVFYNNQYFRVYEWGMDLESIT